jgi:hypothetical protein
MNRKRSKRRAGERAVYTQNSSDEADAESDTHSIIQGLIGRSYGLKKASSEVNSQTDEVNRELKKIQTYVALPFASNELPFDD